MPNKCLAYFLSVKLEMYSSTCFFCFCLCCIFIKINTFVFYILLSNAIHFKYGLGVQLLLEVTV